METSPYTLCKWRGIGDYLSALRKNKLLFCPDGARQFLLTTTKSSEHHFETNTEHAFLCKYNSCRLPTDQEHTTKWLNAQKRF